MDLGCTQHGKIDLVLALTCGIETLYFTHPAKILAALTKMAGEFALHRVVAEESSNKWNDEHAVLDDAIPCPDPRSPRFPTELQDMSTRGDRTDTSYTTYSS